MHLAVRLFGLALIATVGLVACASTATAAKPAAVSIKGTAFVPPTLEIAKGTTVTWTNDDTFGHTVTSGANRTKDNKFDSPLEAKATFSFTFDTAGTFDYFCSRHSSMKGTVTVK
jgi:plastocyanin